MAKTKIQAGAEIDTLTLEELEKGLSRGTREWFQEEARGVSTFEIRDAAVVALSAVTLPASTSIGYGPDSGTAWAVQRITAAGLGTNDVLKIYRDAITDVNFVGQCTAASPVFKPGSKGLILRGGQRLVMNGTSLAATGFVSVNGEGIEIAETDIYKLL